VELTEEERAEWRVSWTFENYAKYGPNAYCNVFALVDAFPTPLYEKIKLQAGESAVRDALVDKFVAAPMITCQRTDEQLETFFETSIQKCASGGGATDGGSSVISNTAQDIAMNESEGGKKATDDTFVGADLLQDAWINTSATSTMLGNGGFAIYGKAKETGPLKCMNGSKTIDRRTVVRKGRLFWCLSRAGDGIPTIKAE
jgi:hypothetical protein